MIEAKHSPQDDAVYVRLGQGAYHQSEEAAPGITLDFDDAGRLLGIEVLGASKRLAPGPWMTTKTPEAAAE